MPPTFDAWCWCEKLATCWLPTSLMELLISLPFASASSQSNVQQDSIEESLKFRTRKQLKSHHVGKQANTIDSHNALIAIVQFCMRLKMQFCENCCYTIAHAGLEEEAFNYSFRHCSSLQSWWLCNQKTSARDLIKSHIEGFVESEKKTSLSHGLRCDVYFGELNCCLIKCLLVWGVAACSRSGPWHFQIVVEFLSVTSSNLGFFRDSRELFWQWGSQTSQSEKWRHHETVSCVRRRRANGWICAYKKKAKTRKIICSICFGNEQSIRFECVCEKFPFRNFVCFTFSFTF